MAQKTKHRFSDDLCLQCEQVRSEVRQTNAGCVVDRGYDLITVWPAHRWMPWDGKDLAAFGVAEKFYRMYRATPVRKLKYLPCEHTINGHAWGMNVYGELMCIWCEVKPQKIHFSDPLPTSVNAWHTVDNNQQLEGK